MIEVIRIYDFKMVSINGKYKTSTFKLSTAYKNFKTILFYSLKRLPELLKPPYKITIYVKTYIDIDNPLKPILDTLEDTIIENDRRVIHLEIIKIEGVRGRPSSIRVFAEGEYKLPDLDYFPTI